MAGGNKYGKISPCMKAIGLMIKLTVEADSYMGMEMFMKESGKMTKLTEKEYTLKTMVRATQASGFKISSMDSALKNGQMALLIKGILIAIKYALRRSQTRQRKIYMARWFSLRREFREQYDGRLR